MLHVIDGNTHATDYKMKYLAELKKNEALLLVIEKLKLQLCDISKEVACRGSDLVIALTAEVEHILSKPK